MDRTRPGGDRERREPPTALESAGDVTRAIAH